MKKIHECETLYLVNEIDFGNSDAGFVIPPQTYPDLKVSDRPEHFFKPGDISVPSPLFAFMRIRRLISTNLVETRALRTFFFFFQSIIIMAKDGGIKFSKTEGMGKSCPPPKK